MKKLFLVICLVFAAFIHLVSGSDDNILQKLPSELVNRSGKKVQTAEALKGKMVAFYFSASWCPPCKAFTPVLVKFYRDVAKKSPMELVFVSSDKTPDAMEAYMKKSSMPWLAIPYDDQARGALKKDLKVNGIPRLIVFDAQGKMLSSDARWDVVLLGKKAVEEWQKPDYKPLTVQDFKEKKGIKDKDKDKDKKSRKKKSKRKKSDD